MSKVPVFADEPTGVEHHKVLARGIERAFASRARALLHQTLYLHCETRWVPDGTGVKVEVFRVSAEPANKIAEFLAGAIKDNSLICTLDNKKQGIVSKEHLEQGGPTPIWFRFLVGRGAEEAEPLKGETRPAMKNVRFRLVRPCLAPVEFLPFVHSF